MRALWGISGMVFGWAVLAAPGFADPVPTQGVERVLRLELPPGAEASAVRDLHLKARGDWLPKLFMAHPERQRLKMRLLALGLEPRGVILSVWFEGDDTLLRDDVVRTLVTRLHASFPLAAIHLAEGTDRHASAKLPPAASAVPVASMSALGTELRLPSAEQLPGKVVAIPSSMGPGSWSARPWLAAGASTLLPGAGQALNGDWPRGAAYLGATGLLYGLAYAGMQTFNPSLSQVCGYALFGLSLAAPVDAFIGANLAQASASASVSGRLADAP